ncbi:hypothetical protein FFF34_002125 [Inquilinus sp. KBS0705]|nr:hypothetical protein FFF34_002125 [Inquilinus sp. KBS0705]
MKQYVIICALALASCAGNSHKNTPADSVNGDTAGTDTALATSLNTPAQNMEYCFMRTEGTNNQDTTKVHLVINAGKVSGEMNWMPKEKDSRKGTLLGTMKGNDIKAVWSFMQEGMTDTLAVAFKLSAQQLEQKPSVYNKANGREQLNTKAGYTLVYKLDNCK